MQLRNTATTLALAALLAACGGGGAGHLAPTSTSGTSSAPTSAYSGSDSALSLACDDAGADQGLSARLNATRQDGVAPLAVMFDASCTTASSPDSFAFHHVRYAFDFGDERGETWPVSGLPKNQQEGGPLAAHVFDQPGVYQVTVRARDAEGAASEATVTVTVRDAQSTFSGSRTVCVAGSSDYAGCPEGAARQSSLPAEQGLSGRRVLLRRGETFGSISIPHGSSNVQIGAFGSGAKPRVPRITIGNVRPDSSAFPNEITISDLLIQSGIEQYATASRLLFYRNDFEAPTGQNIISQLNIASALGYVVQNHGLPADQYFQPREIFVVSNIVRGSLNNPVVNMVGEGSRFAIMGNDMGVAQQHTLRIFAMHKGYIAHNALRGISSDGIRHAMKIHSGGLERYDDNYALSRSNWASREIIIANNTFGDASDNNSWTVTVSPENPGPDSRQGIEDVVLENNIFHRGARTNTEAILVGRRISQRGNMREHGAFPNINQGVSGGYTELPNEWKGPYFVQ